MIMRLQVNATPSGGAVVSTPTCHPNRFGLNFSVLYPRLNEENHTGVTDLNFGLAHSFQPHCDSRFTLVNSVSFWRQQHQDGLNFGVSNGATLASGGQFVLLGSPSGQSLGLYLGAKLGVAAINYYRDGHTVFDAPQAATNLGGQAGLRIGSPQGNIYALFEAQHFWGPLKDSTTLGIVIGANYFLFGI